LRAREASAQADRDVSAGAAVREAREADAAVLELYERLAEDGRFYALHAGGNCLCLHLPECPQAEHTAAQ